MYSNVTFQDLIEWTSGQTQFFSENFPVHQISTDSRSVKPGDVFVALKGDSFDGHQFVADTVAKGCRAVVVERPTGINVPTLIVNDCLRAMVSISKHLRERFHGPCIAITGSAGKSSTKDMLAVLFGENTVSSPASFNNLLGVSKTLFLLNDSTKNLVLEMGMNAKGEIREMCEAFRPRAGIITNIGDAHIGRLGGQRGIYEAKKELFDYLSAQGNNTVGVALNVDDLLVKEAAEAAFQSNGVKTISYSANGNAAEISVFQKRVDPESAQLALKLKIGGGAVEHRFNIFGLHHAQNIAAAVAAAWLFGVSRDDIVSRFSSIKPAAHRGEVIPLAHERVLIDECYNSNPTALTSSLESLSLLVPDRRRILIVGDMLELGDFSESLHAQVGDHWARLADEKSLPFVLVAVGSQMKHFLDAVRRKLPSAVCFQVSHVDEVLPLISPLLRPRDVLLVKGSRGIKLDKVVDALKA